jgi:hypothetical protein
MLARLRRLFWVAAWVGGLGYVGYFGIFLREWGADHLREKAQVLGLALPLKDPRIEIHLSRMSLSLFEGDKLVTRYDIGYSAGLPGRMSQHEFGTPIGEFTVIAKQYRTSVWSLGSRFLVLDFPNSESLERLRDAELLSDAEADSVEADLRDGRAPRRAAKLALPLGIQGNFLFFRGRRFTEGNVALSNRDINELYEYVPVGTPVRIIDGPY